MAMVINTNISSLNAQRQLSGSASKLATSMERLSSGLRINSAKDDAAGLAISSRMTTQITGLNVAQRNANDGISLAQTAEGALSTIGNNLQRIRELAVQSRNATNSSEDRAALQKEVEQLKSEITRVAETTSFNGTKLLDGSFTNKSFQVGANQGERIDISSIVDATELGTWNKVDRPAVAYSAAMGGTYADGDGEVSIAALTLGDNAGESGGEIAAFKMNIGGTEIDVAAITASPGRSVALAHEAVADEFVTAVGTQIPGVTVTKNATNDGVEFTNTTGQALAFTSTNSSLTNTGGITAAEKHAELAGGALTINGKAINVAAAVSDEERAKQIAAKVNEVFTDGSVKASVVGGALRLESAKDIKIDAAPATGAGFTAGDEIKVVKGTEVKGIASVSIATAEGADDTIAAMDAALKAVNSARADLGAIQNRFESVVSNLATTSENLTASRSRILDADFAVETANLSSAQVLQQAGTAMVAQANQLPQNVLSLLR
ncbi:flagellin [Comamonas sp.]